MIQSLRKTLQLAHFALEQHAIPHALIGGIALAGLGINRATSDVDLIAPGDQKDQLIAALQGVGFVLEFQTSEVLHLGGVGKLDVLLANRPISVSMLKNAKRLGPEGVRILEPEDIIGLKIQAYSNNPRRKLQDQADILSLIESYPQMDWNKLKTYADLFQAWPELEALKASLQ